jgi:outer membrane protein OmpA-like peptidoglycan-associated protein
MRQTCTNRARANAIAIRSALLLGALTFAGAARFADAASIDDMEPSANLNGTLGLGQIVSAEAMGQGRLTVTARGNLYVQAKDFPGAPAKDAQITTGTIGAGFGVNPYMDIFAAANLYNLNNVQTGEGTGLGTVLGGVQGSIPFSESIPGRLGFQLAVLAGSAGSQIDSNRADGYNYFETRTGTDFSFKLTQSIVWKSLLAFRLHFNEGIVTSLQSNKDALLLQGIGVEFAPAPSFVLGAEFHSRAVLKDYTGNDPFWFAPSFEFRSAPNHLNLQIGSEISMSQTRPTPDRALEPWRMFGALTWSYNPNPGRARDAAKAREDSLSRARLEEQARRAQALADSLTRKAREDSLAQADSNAVAKRRADSLAMKAKQDSLALLDAQRRLEEERSHRTDWEKEFLRTGVLNLEALYFETGRAEISINSKPYLNLVGKMLSKYPKLQMEIAGHTDNVGGTAANLKLSQDRADAVRLYLSAAYSELNGRLSAHGYGSAQPKTSNKTAEGRQINRRVEITVLNKDALKEYE